MSDFESLVKLFESHGLSGKEAIAEAKEREARAEAKEREERACELFYCYFIVVLFHCRII